MGVLARVRRLGIRVCTEQRRGVWFKLGVGVQRSSLAVKRPNIQARRPRASQAPARARRRPGPGHCRAGRRGGGIEELMRILDKHEKLLTSDWSHYVTASDAAQ